MEQERRVLRWGGLAGILGSIVFVVVFVVVIVFAGVDPAEAEDAVIKAPDIRTARIVENGLYLAVLVLWACHFLALHQALRATSLAPALFGSALGIFGLILLAAGALPHIATTPISDLYHEAGASAEDKAALVIVWEATTGIFDALLVAGFLVMPVGVLFLGLAMRETPAFGRGLGLTSVVFGVAGIVAGCVLLGDADSPMAFIGVLTAILFHLVIGWKLYGLSNAVMPVLADS